MTLSKYQQYQSEKHWYLPNAAPLLSLVPVVPVVPIILRLFRGFKIDPFSSGDGWSLNIFLRIWAYWAYWYFFHQRRRFQPVPTDRPSVLSWYFREVSHV